MITRASTVIALFLILGTEMPAGQFPPGYVDPAPLLTAAAREIGEANLKCITYGGNATAAPLARRSRTRSTWIGRASMRWPITRALSTGREARARRPSIENPG